MNDDTRLTRLVDADKVLKSLLGREKGSVAGQYVRSHASEIKKLLGHGLSATRIAELLSSPLNARPSTVLTALRNAGLVPVSEKKHRNVHQETAQASATPRTPKVSETRPVTIKPKEPAATAKMPERADPLGVANKVPAPVESKSIISSNRIDLPPWADGSDQLEDESDDDYILRKTTEGDPQEKRKFIGEHNA